MNLYRSTNTILFAVAVLMVVLAFFIVKFINTPPQPSPIQPMVLNVDSIRGQVLFRADCALCHRTKERLHYYLEGVLDRLGEPYLKLYITKQDSLLVAKDPYATALIEKFNGVRGKHNFPYTDDELNYIIASLR